ncbi:copper resistance protein CopC [Microbispora sp. RL4-1S]|uniref:Copper resistance protein CopC n=1 Tax=Microbispora oryzae TaxID=2806554 RepID=A0A941AK23_9ACTN|nr:copper resistance CopC family protein [Microbispora oryzae]MBP2707020.1 copper resistance protein CopC [Microbispora oryzae]
MAACVPIFLFAAPAQAHNVLVGSDPKDGARLTAAPARVTLTFDQAVRRDFARIAVTGPDGAHYEQGDVGVSGDDVFIGLRAGASGTYQIGYRIVSNDGHPVTGTLTYTVGDGAAPGGAGPSAGASAGSGTASDGTTGGTAGGITGGTTGGTAAAPGAYSGTGSGAGGGSSGGWVWGLLVAMAALLALAVRVLVRHDRRTGSAA